jgi:hypothetical protein
MKSFIFSNVAEPMPLILSKSSIVLNGPFLLRQAAVPWAATSTYAGQGLGEPGLGSVDVLALKLALSHGDQIIPPIERVTRTNTDIKVTTHQAGKRATHSFPRHHLFRLIPCS